MMEATGILIRAGATGCNDYQILYSDNFDGGQGNWQAVEALVIEDDGKTEVLD